MPTLEELYLEDPTRGRHTLARLAGCTQYKAQTFLQSMKHPETSPPTPAVSPLEAQIKAAGITEKELAVILQSVKSTPQSRPKSQHVWNGQSFKFATISDTHFGHVKSHEEWWLRACDLIRREGCQLVLLPGDITEGMSGRPGHVYELDAVGVTAQIDLAVRRLSMLPCPVEAITGNHDGWAYKSVGVDVGAELAAKLPNYKHLGQDEADVTINGVTIKLWHGGDGSSYATSYRTQKFVEGLTGGEKPHILLSGHAHKAIMHECRNVMVFECGTLCGQTGWMRGKKLAAHCGFWIIEVFPAPEGGIERLKSEWVPFFN